MPSEYNREVFGGEMSEACEFGSRDEARDILGLMMRHWNTIAGTLLKGEVYVPLLLEDETAWRTATTGHAASCAGCTCGTMVGLSLSITRRTAGALSP